MHVFGVTLTFDASMSFGGNRVHLFASGRRETDWNVGRGERI